MSDEKNIKKINDPFELLQKLSDIGKKTKLVEISNDFKVVLSTFDSEDEMQVFENVENYKGSEYLTRHKIEALSYSIIEVNGISLRDYEKETDVEKKKALKQATIDKVRTIVTSWKDEFVSFMYSRFNDLVNESEEEMIKLGFMKPIVEEKKEEEKKEELKQEDKKQEKKE